jgi:hypothetical protein
MKPCAEFRRVLGGQSRVADGFCQVDNCLRTQAAVEMFVEENFGKRLKVDGHE